MITALPGFKSLSEFGSYHGDCGQCATLGVLHALDPSRFLLNLSELDHLTADTIAHGEADPKLSGGMNIEHLSAWLDRLGVPHTTVGYAAFHLDTFHADLKAHAGKHGVIVEWSHGGNLPGDEKAVQFHYSSCGGLDTGPKGDGVGGCYLWCDGDNAASSKADGGSAALRYTWAQVVAAAPIAYIIVLGTPHHWTVERDSQGRITGATCDTGDHCGAGMAALLEARSALGTRPVVHPGELYYAPGKSCMPLDNGEVYWWHDGSAPSAERPAVGVAELLALLAGASGKAAELAAEVDALKQHQGDPHAQAVGAAFLQCLASAASK